MLQDTRTPLPVWFRAMWWVTTQKNGASALGLQRVLGLKSYETAWTWLHKFRRAMVRPGRDLLTGRIEMDETYLGGLQEGLRGRLTEKKALIVVAAQEDGKGIGRIRMRQIPDASAESLESFLLDSIHLASYDPPDSRGMKRRKCPRCQGHTFELFEGPRPEKRTLGYFIRCLTPGCSLSEKWIEPHEP